MARETVYLVQAFNAGKGGSLKADDADSLPNGGGGAPNGGAAGPEQSRCCRFLVHRRCRDRRL